LSETKQRSICKQIKILSMFYSQNKYSKKRGHYIYYNPECKECKKKKSFEWIQDNRERFREINLNYFSTEKGKQNRRKRKETQSTYYKQWCKENPNWMREYSQNRRAAKKNLEADFTSDDWQECLEYFDHECAYCGISEKEHLEQFGKQLSQDHFIPLIEDGTYTKDNIIPSCSSCNSSKRTRSFFDWYPNHQNFSEESLSKIIYYLSLHEQMSEVI
jgi:arsenate reductase-like glutaredoxin family protein